MTDHADFFSMLGQAARDVRSLAPEALDDRRRALLDAGKPRPPAKGIMDWRAVVDAAIKQGDVAEEKISERDREALLCLEIEPRREAMGNPEDPRVKNLSRADADLVRESLGGPGKKPKRAKIDPIKAAAERRERERETLRDFQAAFRDRIAVARQTLEAALRRSHRQPEAVATAVLQALLVTPPPILLHRLDVARLGRTTRNRRPGNGAISRKTLPGGHVLHGDRRKWQLHENLFVFHSQCVVGYA